MTPRIQSSHLTIRGRAVIKLGWAFFILCCLIAAAYSLNRGIYTGSELVQIESQYYWLRKCRYLYVSGVTDRYVGEVGKFIDRDWVAAETSCKLLGSD
jgi:hypothetical protein